MTVRYSPAAREDLRELRCYLTGEFGATVADKALRKIVSDISLLKVQPHLLLPLSDKVKRATDYLYFLCGRYSVVIATQEPHLISVVRILDGRTDYAATVFGCADSPTMSADNA